MKNVSLELGNLTFNTNKNQIYQCPDYLMDTLKKISTTLNHYFKYDNVFGNPFSNSGSKYKNDVFEVEAYSWDEEYEQPYNFKYKDIKISWYKYLGRDTTVNKEISYEECQEMENNCLKSIEKDLKIFYIFLDIDGVLNNDNYTLLCYQRCKEPFFCSDVPFDNRNIEALMYLCNDLKQRRYNVNIILSSTWRLRKEDMVIANSRLAQYGLNISDKTPYINQNRGLEIKEFLKDKVNYNFLIIDDESFDIENIFHNNFVKVNSSCGFTMEDVDTCLHLLNEGGYNEEKKDT